MQSSIGTTPAREERIFSRSRIRRMRNSDARARENLFRMNFMNLIIEISTLYDNDLRAASRRASRYCIKKNLLYITYTYM